MEKLFIPLLLGTAREGRRSERAARFVYDELRKHPDIESEFLDIRDHVRDVTLDPRDPGGAKEKPTAWKKIMERADGLIIVSPEYNRGYPGELKILLDSLYDEYNRKPVAVCGVSSGAYGGARMAELIKPTLAELGFTLVRHKAHFPQIKKLFDEEGDLIDKGLREKTGAMIEELVWYAQALKATREATNN